MLMAEEAIEELFLLISLEIVFDRLLTLSALTCSGPLISQCFTWGISLLTWSPRAGKSWIPRMMTNVRIPPTTTKANSRVARVATPRDTPRRRRRPVTGYSKAVTSRAATTTTITS